MSNKWGDFYVKMGAGKQFPYEEKENYIFIITRK